jgi:TetR/AcrR family fatty acid metabolism transcriptional regulator
MGIAGRKKTPEKEEQILQAAVEVFAAKDFHEVLVDDVAARAGVGKGTVYRYFPTKEDLYFATVFAGMDQLRAEVERAARGRESVREILEAIAIGFLAFFWSRRPLLALIYRYEMRLSGPQEAEWLKRRGAIADEVAGVFARGVASGEVSPIDPRLAAELFLGMIRAINVYRTEKHDAETLGRQVAAAIIEGLGRKGERASAVA